MKSDETSAEGGSIKNPILRFILLVLALFEYVFVDSAKWMHKKVYQEGWQSGWHWLVGVFLAYQVGMNGGIIHGPESFAKWNAALSAIATYLYLWPAFFLGSHYLWESVENYRQGRWFRHLLTTIAWISMLLSALSLGKGIVATFVAHPVSLGVFVVAAEAIGWVLAVLAFFIVIGLVSVGLFFLSQEIVAAVTGLGFVYLLAPHLAGMVAKSGLTSTDAQVLQWSLWVAYLFPLTNIIATRWFSWVKTGVIWLKTKAYKTPKDTYEKFFGQAINIGLSAFCAYMSVGLWDRLGMVPAAAYVLSALVFYVMYILAGDLLNSVFDNRTLGLVAAGSASAIAYSNHTTDFLGTYGGMVAVVSMAMIVYNAAYPIAFLAVRLLANPLLASWLGEPLFKLHARASEGFSKLMREVGKMADNTYSDKTTFRGIFVHTLNLMAAGMMFKLYAGLGYVVATLLALCSYVVLGGLLLWAGPVLLGAGAAIYGGFETGNRAYAALPNEPWTSGFLGFVVAGLALMLAIPLFYSGLQKLAAQLSEERLKKILSVLDFPYVKLLAKMSAVWNAFLPYWHSFVAAIAKAKNAIVARLQSVWQMVQPHLQKLQAAIRETQKAIRETMDKLRRRKTPQQAELNESVNEPPANTTETVNNAPEGTPNTTETVSDVPKSDGKPANDSNKTS